MEVSPYTFRSQNHFENFTNTFYNLKSAMAQIENV